jgi:TonB family protein
MLEADAGDGAPAGSREVDMLDVLVASRSPKTLRPRWLSGSLILHLIVFALAVEASRVEAGRTGPVMADTTLLFLPRLAPPNVRPAEPARAPGGGSGAGVGTLVLTVDPPPRGFRTVVAPGDIPTAIPPVDLTQTAMDPRDFTGRGAEGGVAWGVVGGTGSIEQTPVALEDAGDVVYAATLDDARFEPAELVSQPLPRYPPAMLAMGVSGRVVVEFIVDTLGTVERRSITVLSSTHKAFEEPARSSASRAIFRPARLGTYPVRQRSRQPISFIARQ